MNLPNIKLPLEMNKSGQIQMGKCTCFTLEIVEGSNLPLPIFLFARLLPRQQECQSRPDNPFQFNVATGGEQMRTSDSDGKVLLARLVLLPSLLYTM